MKLSDLTEILEDKSITGMANVDIGGITVDSREVHSGDLFVAVKGWKSDGHEYVADAVNRGAAAVVTETPIPALGRPNVVVGNAAKALAELSARFFGNPAENLFLCGITGTNGKSSTAFLYRSIVQASSWGKIGILGTLGHGYGDELTRTVHTTPDAVELHRQLKYMVDAGCRGVVMEVSSHAVRQHRVWGLDFNIGILTNVTHDHLDYHSTLEDYRAAKTEFCYSLIENSRKKRPGTLVYSEDDPVSRDIGRRFPGDKIPVGAGVGSAGTNVVYSSGVDISLEGTSFRLHLGSAGEVDVSMKLLGSFCAVNASMAAAAASVTGIDPQTIKAGLEALAGIPGRFETIGGKGKPVVVIDYSHTPDAMERILQTCRGLKPRQLITVFGCGGDRDRSKRPLMGGVAQRLSDFCYLTTDNPRTEPIDSIIEDILGGMDRGTSNFVVDLDRSRVIREAVKNAAERDVIALLGKGHEEYQIVGTERVPFSDRKEAEGALREWRAG